MSSVSALAGARPSWARIAERSASRPIWEPDPSSPSANPRPPMIVSLAPTRAIAAEPVPAITSPPSAPACAPMQAVVASFAAHTSRKPGKAAATRVWSLPCLNPASPKPSRDRSPINVAEPGLSQNLVDGGAHSSDRRGKIDMNVRRRAARLCKRFSIRVAQSRAAMGGAAVDAEIERRAGHAASPSSVRSIIAAAAARSASAAWFGVSRLSLAPCGDCSGVTGKCTKTAGIADLFSLRYCKAPK